MFQEEFSNPALRVVEIPRNIQEMLEANAKARYEIKADVVDRFTTPDPQGSHKVGMLTEWAYGDWFKKKPDLAIYRHGAPVPDFFFEDKKTLLEAKGSPCMKAEFLLILEKRDRHHNTWYGLGRVVYPFDPKGLIKVILYPPVFEEVFERCSRFYQGKSGLPGTKAMTNLQCIKHGDWNLDVEKARKLLLQVG